MKFMSLEENHSNKSTKLLQEFKIHLLITLRNSIYISHVPIWIYSCIQVIFLGSQALAYVELLEVSTLGTHTLK